MYVNGRGGGVSVRHVDLVGGTCIQAPLEDTHIMMLPKSSVGSILVLGKEDAWYLFLLHLMCLKLSVRPTPDEWVPDVPRYCWM